jgi:hypothetical protein
LPGIQKDLTKAYLCPEVMLDDLQKLRDALDKINPDLYHYVSKEQLDSAYRVAITKVSNDLSAYEFCKTIAQFLSNIKDSHTNFNPQTLVFLGSKNKGTLPFFLIKIGDKFYAESVYNDEFLKGKEIIQFNDVSVKTIFNESMAFSLVEGNAIEAQEQIATKGMALTFSQMSFFNSSDFVKIKYISDEDTLTRNVKATNKMALYLYKGPIIEKSISYFFDEENKGILKILSFQPKAMGFFKKELAKFFKEVEKRHCSNIVIDLRDNQGGYVKAQEYLISFLNYQRKQYSIQHVYKRSNFDPFAKLPFFKKKRFKRIAKRGYPLGIHSDEYDFMNSELGTVSKILYSEKLQNEFNQTYNGKCTLVLNGLSMSASVLFAGWFQNADRGDIIGWPCLGSMGGSFGSNINLNLPGTGLPVMISTVKFNPLFSMEELNNPIILDQHIEYTVNDILTDTDPVWKFLNIKKGLSTLETKIK